MDFTGLWVLFELAVCPRESDLCSSLMFLLLFYLFWTRSMPAQNWELEEDRADL